MFTTHQFTKIAQLQPGNRASDLFEFVREHDHVRWPCELRDHGEYGCEAQFFRNEKFHMSRTFTPRDGHPRTLAIARAEAERKHVEAYV
jgi:hypothetical protein